MNTVLAMCTLALNTLYIAINGQLLTANS